VITIEKIKAGPNDRSHRSFGVSFIFSYLEMHCRRQAIHCGITKIAAIGAIVIHKKTCNKLLQVKEERAPFAIRAKG
jgi:hypothetical protein